MERRGVSFLIWSICGAILIVFFGILVVINTGFKDFPIIGSENTSQNRTFGNLVSPECSDGLDNDADGFIDISNDRGCSGETDDDEKSECQNGVDDDFDGWIDVVDPGCINNQDNNEINDFLSSQCSDEEDNDDDNLIDGYDSDCEDPRDSSEGLLIVYACSDGLDNDGDTLIDMDDPGCDNLGDESEENVMEIESFLCRGFGGDQDYMYDLTVKVFNKQDGKETFSADLNGALFRTNHSNERFYADRSNGVISINYDITSTCGGVDITYTLENPTSQSQPLPDFFVEGIVFPKTNAKYLYPKEWGTLYDALSGNSILYQLPYPDNIVYSPVMVAVNAESSMGASFQYPFTQYKHTIQPFLHWNSDGSAAYSYITHYNIPHIGSDDAQIGPGETRRYTITLRFAPRRNWLLTIYPYRQYFNSLYDSTRSSRPKNHNPIAGFGMADISWQNDLSNPRGYLPDSVNPPGIERNRVDYYGWKNTTDWAINTFVPLGYKRTMMWVPSGVYKESACPACNFPPQFMDWLPKLVETQSELLRMKQAGLSLGFWWGNSGSVPVPNSWPPSRIQSADYNNVDDKEYLQEQFNLAKERGADEIGLDAFTLMEPRGKYEWVDDMLSTAPNIHLIHETGGADIFHARIGNFYTDSYNSQNHGWNYIGGPHLLSWYINPRSEIWVLPSVQSGQLSSSALKSRAQQLTKWGYTYVDVGNTIDVNGWDTTMSECLDGIDNNGDGKKDWPRDLECVDEYDLSED